MKERDRYGRVLLWDRSQQKWRKFQPIDARDGLAAGNLSEQEESLDRKGKRGRRAPDVVTEAGVEVEAVATEGAEI